MKTNIHTAASRGQADHGWLQSAHSFSFANWYDPSRIQFGALRVLNDDAVAPSRGFGAHPHDNMEIVSIPLEGVMEHRDSMGSQGSIVPGEVQAMSAGTGIVHSEFNGSDSDILRFLQIWILPSKRGIKPRYEQRRFRPEDRHNAIQMLVEPHDRQGRNGVGIHQEAYIARSAPDAEKLIHYKVHVPNNGIYLFLLEGKIEVLGHELGRRDALEITESNGAEIAIAAKEASDILIIEVPMNP